MYLIAAFASVAMALALTAAPRDAAYLFPQATYEDLLRAIQAVYR
jgi:hypothetical protein